MPILPILSRIPVLSRLYDAPVVHRALSMRAGQAVCFHAKAGTELHVADGDVELLEPPLLLAGTMHWPRQRLASGRVVALACSGWFALRAQRDTVLQLRHSPRVFSWTRIARILSGWRRRRLAH